MGCPVLVPDRPNMGRIPANCFGLLIDRNSDSFRLEHPVDYQWMYGMLMVRAESFNISCHWPVDNSERPDPQATHRPLVDTIPFTLQNWCCRTEITFVYWVPWMDNRTGFDGSNWWFLYNDSQNIPVCSSSSKQQIFRKICLPHW